jgi:hypothetical protein
MRVMLVPPARLEGHAAILVQRQARSTHPCGIRRARRVGDVREPFLGEIITGVTGGVVDGDALGGRGHQQIVEGSERDASKCGFRRSIAVGDHVSQLIVHGVENGRIQPKLLRVLQEREFERLGSAKTRKVDVRVVAATHRALEEMILGKQFRLDLYYRLNVFPLSIPPLRERPEDIPLLVRHFVQQFAQRMNKTISAISSETMDVLARYPWPGNIRELQNVVERSVVVYKKGDLSVNESWLRRESFQFEPAAQALSKRSSMEEREIIWAALTETRGWVSGPFGAATKLGIPPSTLESKLRSMNIDKYRFKASSSSAQRSRIQDRFSRTSRIREETANL